MDLRRAAALPLALWAACAPSAAPPPAPAADAPAAHVLIVSVDGLRPDALAERARLPAYARLLDGAVTLDARCDPDWSVTLPNHVGMLTGRTTEGAEGHGWRLNDMPPPGLLLRGGQPSALHVAAAAGLATAMIAGKEKFVLFPRSWNGADQGAPNGIIHHYSWSASATENARALLEFWSTDATGSLAFLHFAEPDRAGHAAGWDLAPGSGYLAAVAVTDGALGTVLAWLDERPARRARTAIVLTTDHGGGVPFKNHHGAERALVNRRIPFLVWHGGGAARGDLYALNPADRRAPGDADPARDDPGPPPVRNLDAADVALGLLGLPPLARTGDRGARPLRVLAAADR
jgi:hypothetical protein